MDLLRHLPQLLDADAVGLRVNALAEVEGVEQLLGQAAAAALGEDGVGGAQLHAGLMVGAGLTVLLDPHVAGGDADHAAILDQRLGGGEAGVDLHPERLGLGAEPAHHVAERGDVVAVVVQRRRRRQLDGAVLGKEQEPVIRGRRGERRAELLPVRQQLVQRARLDHRAGEDMGADLAALFHHADRRFGGKLFEADRGGQAGRAGAHDHHIEFHLLAHGVGHIRSLCSRPDTGAWSTI